MTGQTMTVRVKMTLRAKRLDPGATLPSRAEPGSVGYDLHALHDVVVQAGSRAPVETGIAVAIPPGCYGRVAPRSGLAVKHGIDVLAGVIDPSYRGQVVVVLHNTSFQGVTLPAGSRIAQLILERCETPEVIEVDALDATERGAGGFGSTGT